MYECTNVRMYECTNVRMYECMRDRLCAGASAHVSVCAVLCARSVCTANVRALDAIPMGDGTFSHLHTLADLLRLPSTVGTGPSGPGTALVTSRLLESALLGQGARAHPERRPGNRQTQPKPTSLQSQTPLTSRCITLGQPCRGVPFPAGVNSPGSLAQARPSTGRAHRALPLISSRGTCHEWMCLA